MEIPEYVECSSCKRKVHRSRMTYIRTEGTVIPVCVNCVVKFIHSNSKLSVRVGILIGVMLIVGNIIFILFGPYPLEITGGAFPFILYVLLSPFFREKVPEASPLPESALSEPAVCANDEKPAIATCAYCFKPYCIDCFEQTSSYALICTSCTKLLRKRRNTSELVMITGISIGIAIECYAMSINPDNPLSQFLLYALLLFLMLRLMKIFSSIMMYSASGMEFLQDIKYYYKRAANTQEAGKETSFRSYEG